MRVVFLVFRVDLCVVRVDAEPRLACCEAGVFGCVPLHRCAGVVAGDHLRLFQGHVRCVARQNVLVVGVFCIGVVVIFNVREAHVRHANLFTLIHERRAGQGVQQHREHFGGNLPVFLVVAIE